jgi:hypothetical protein
MANKRQSDLSSAPLVSPKLKSPSSFLLNMLVFLAIVGFIAAIAYPTLKAAFGANPFLNGLIGFVFLVGVLYTFRQVLRLNPEIRWVNAFRIADPGLAIEHQPVLLAPMANMLRDRTGAISLSTASMRSLMDSIGSRLDEARDIGRYMVGLLVFLGLLGTFWGLLETISSVGGVISRLDTKAAETTMVFEELKAGLAAPLRGMGTAFSASLLGLSGSLVLGFLELQASQAQNRFYNELEEWLSGITELTPGSGGSAEQINRQIYAALYEVQRTLSEVADRLERAPSPTLPPVPLQGSDEAVRDLAKGVNQLVTQMRAEQKVVREWVDDQAAQSGQVAALLRDLASSMGKRV